MPIPIDSAERRNILLRWTAGDASAADFLDIVSEIARLADNILDKTDDQRQQRLAALLECSFGRLSGNVFYAMHQKQLAPVINEAVAGWRLGDEWRTAEDQKRRVFGYVYRESTDRIAVAVAYLIAGHEHSMAVARELYEICHAPFSETVEEWATGE